ncbi:MAG: hypothetical protein JW925_12375 [Syntrophaceae bacterium]|nr:hypothetical protein [Syntrophaceae bacterium]
MNFDELADFQLRLRRQEDYCKTFILLDAITDDEAAKIWDFLMENSLDVDREGVIRKKLLPRLNPVFVAESLHQKPGGRTRVIPEALQLAIELYLLK